MDVTNNLFERKMTVNERLKADLAEKERVIAENLSSRDDAIRAAIQNEKLTRQRVEALEKVLSRFAGMSLKHRLQWVFMGRIWGKRPNERSEEVRFSGEVKDQAAKGSIEVKEEPVNAS